MVLEKIISAIASVTMMSSVVPSGLSLSVLPEDSVVEQASEGEEDTTWTVIDYTKPENQNLSEEDLALMHEDNWLNQEVVKRSATNYSGDWTNSGGSKSGHTLDQLDLNDFLAVKSIAKTSNRLTQLPESIKFFSNLTILNLQNNRLTSLQESIGNLASLTKLYLSENNLTSLPDSIGNLTNLTELRLDKNQITQIPNSIRNLTKLKSLNVSYNDLTSLPDSIGNLSNLTELNLQDNKLIQLSNSIGNLTSLTKLSLSKNKLKTLPESIGNLTKLKSLDLNETYSLTSLPDSIGNLTNLTSLSLYDNRLTSIPNSIGTLASLTSLNLSENCLTQIPDSIGNLTNLTSLGLGTNQLTQIPDSIVNLTNLTSLNLRYNKLTSLPESIGNLTKLTKLVVQDNYLTKKYIENGDYDFNFIDSVSSHYKLSDYYHNSIDLEIHSDRSDLLLGISTSSYVPDSVEERLVISSSNQSIVDNNGNAVGCGICDVTISLPGNPEGNQAGQVKVKVQVNVNPVDDFITTPSKDKIQGALDELDSNRDSGEDISAKKDEVINKGKDYVGSDSVSKDAKIEYIDKIIDNLVDEDKKVVTRDDVVSTITVLPSEDRKQPIDTLVDKSQDTSDTFIDGGNQLTLKVNDTSLEVGQSLDLEDVTEVTYNGVNLDSSQIDSLELIPSEEGYFTGTKALKAGRTKAKVKLTSEALAIQTYNGGDENPIISNEMNVTIEQPVISSGSTSANGDVTVKYDLNETAQLSLSTQVVDFGVSTGISEVSQETPMTATVKSSAVYDLDLSPQTNLVNEEDPSVEIPSTKASISFNDAVDFTALPVPNSSLNLVTNGNATTALENRSKVYNMNFKIGDVIGSKAGKYKMPIRITLTQK